MLAGPIEGSVRILKELKKTGYELHALTNWSAETFPLVRGEPDYRFLGLFRDIFVSGALGMAKPREDIFRHALAAMGVAPAVCLYIDDTPANVATAARLGMHAHHFRDARSLASVLHERGL